MKMKLLNKVLLLIFLVFTANNFAQFGQQKELVKIQSYKSFDKVFKDGEFKLAVKAEIEKEWHINSNRPYDEFLIPSKLVIDSAGPFKLEKTTYPKAEDIKLGFSDEPLSVWQGEIYIGGLVKVNKNIEPGIYPLIIELQYQSCNNNTCLPPTSVKDTLKVEVVNKQSVVNEINQDVFKKIDLSYSAASGAVKQSDSVNSLSNIFENNGIILGLIFVFLGGLALNLTPCVYPLIPITIGFFGGQSEGRTSRLVLMGLLFVLGMAITYSAIGVITALSGAVFGALLQNTFVIIFIALIFVVLSLSMFGVYEFKLPDSLVAKAGGAKSGMFGALFMGLTMGIVAAPCIGPFVLGLVTYVAAKADPYFGFLMFFVLALGLGVPYLFLAIFSGKIKSLPRSGEWMEAVKHVFGFVLIGMALYFLLPLIPGEISGYILPIFMIITALYLLFVDKLANSVKAFKIFKISFSVVLIAVAAYMLYPTEKKSIAWKHYTENALPATISDKKGIIIDFYADWCIPCKELEASTFSDQRVINESKSFYTYKADMTKSLSPEVENLREKFNILGVPTVLIIDSKGNEVKRITGFVGPDEFHSIIKNIN